MSIVEGFDVFSWKEFELGHNLSISQVLKLIRKSNLKTYVGEGPFYPDNSLYKLSDSINYHEWFFDAIEIKLKATGDFSWLSFQAEDKTERIDISFYLNTLTRFASDVVDYLLLENNLKIKNIYHMDDRYFSGMYHTKGWNIVKKYLPKYNGRINYFPFRIVSDEFGKISYLK